MNGSIPIEIVCTFTESPSFNVRILHNGETIFYNSERLQGNDRTRTAGKVLCLSELRVGTKKMDITQEQYDIISEMGKDGE
jgi:hypothetical protein